MEDKIYYKVICMPNRTSVYAKGKYKFVYPEKGKIQCNNNTLGFFMFETLQQAEKFVGHISALISIVNDPVGIIKVKCLAEVKKPENVAHVLYIAAFYYYYGVYPVPFIPYGVTELPLTGTVCCKYIEILP